ncbi:MAG: response regulator [Polyangiaceae bacterium]
MTVLLVDDEAPILRALKRTLGDLPAELITAGDGAQALAVLRTRRVDVMVADIDMPQLDGLELVRAARRESPLTYRILMTGAATMDRTIRAINDGEVVRFFTKPLEPAAFHEEMKTLVERVLRQRREGGQETRKARREALYGWLAERFAGAERIERAPDGGIELDLGRVRQALAGAGVAARRVIGA